jgi:murein hydrolase activator
VRLATCVAVVLALPCLVSAQATDRTRAESQARRASERLTALQREADALAGQQRSLLVELRKLEVERDLRAEQVKQLEAGAETVTRDLANTANQIDALEAETSAARPALESRIVELYKLGNAGYLRLLLNVSDLRELGRAYRMVAALSATDRQRVQRQQQNLERLRNAQQELRQKQAELTRLRQAAQTARTAAERAALARTQLITQIDQRRDLTAELAAELQAAQLKLQQTLAAINAGVPRASVEGSALPIRPFRGVLPWPVTGQMLTRFGSKAARGLTTPGDSGVQFAAAQGSPVRAVHDGSVAYSGPFTGYGNLLIVDHGAQTFSLYGQLGDIQVQRGASVERGQTIGGVGNVPAGIPGIYFEMRIDGKPVDPLEWLAKRP